MKIYMVYRNKGGGWGEIRTVIEKFFLNKSDALDYTIKTHLADTNVVESGDIEEINRVALNYISEYDVE